MAQVTDFCTRFKRFLHYGNETRLYTAGKVYINFELTDITSIESLIEKHDIPDSVVPIINKVVEDGYSAQPYAILFAYAYCVRRASPLVKCTAYKYARKFVDKNAQNSSEYLLIFTHYIRSIALQITEEGSGKGFGHGWRYTIKKWYDSKTALELAQIILANPAIMKWRHKDILILSHISYTDKGKTVLIEYLLKRNYEQLETKYSKCKEAKPVLDLIKSVEKIRTAKEKSVVIQLIKDHNFDIEFCPPFSLGEAEVWSELIPKMGIEKLINSLIMLNKRKLLRSDHVVQKFLTRIGEESLTNIFIHPTKIYIVMREYEAAPNLAIDFQNRQAKEKADQAASGTTIDAGEVEASTSERQTARGDGNKNKKNSTSSTKNTKGQSSSKCKNKNKSKKKQDRNQGDTSLASGGTTATTTHNVTSQNDTLATTTPNVKSKNETDVVKKPPYVPNNDIVSSLHILLGKAFTILSPTNLRYLIAVDSRPILGKRQCYHSRFVCARDAIALVTLSLAKPEPQSNVTIVTCVHGDNPVKEFPFDRIEETFASFTDRINSSTEAKVLNVAKVIEYATNSKEEYDLIVVLSDHTMQAAGVSIALQTYHESVTPHTKLAACSFTGKLKRYRELTKKHMFFIDGFDKNVCQLIIGFGKNAF